MASGATESARRQRDGGVSMSLAALSRLSLEIIDRQRLSVLETTRGTREEERKREKSGGIRSDGVALSLAASVVA